MMYPLVRELAVDGAHIRVPVTLTCRVLKIARQPYYRWLVSPVTDAEVTAAYRANALFDAHRDDPEFGYRFLVDEAREAGEPMAERTAWKICSELGWWSAFGKKRGKNGKKPGPPVHDDLVERDFTADALNELWLADITEHWTGEGKLYLCAIKDVYSNRIIGYSIDSRMKSRLAVAALGNAVARRHAEGAEVAGCVLHSDRGSQGGFNWSSQHPDHGGVRWDVARSRCRSCPRVRGGNGLRIARCGRRCVHRVDLSRRGRCNASSGG
jgi:putative transposase